MLTRRNFARGGAALAAAAALPRTALAQDPPSATQPGARYVRRSIGDLIRENSPVIDSLRRGVDVMMQRPMSDKTSWLFQAAIHDIPDEEITAPLKPFARYWRQCPHGNYFFLSWHRMYLHYFERILRKASGDPELALPYWAYDDPEQTSLPAAFLPADEEMTAKPPVPPLLRKNPLARAHRLPFIDRRLLGLGSVARDVAATLTLDHFATDDKLDAQHAFGGVSTGDPLEEIAAGGIEAAPHNLVHKSIGLDGDMGSPATAARDPIFWLHHANIDRLWVKWTDPARGRVAPLRSPTWMTMQFLFVDEDGVDQMKSGAEILDTQFQLGYRYDDDPARDRALDLRAPAIARAPGQTGGPPSALAPKGGRRFFQKRPAEPVLLARAGATRLAAPESRLALTPVAARGKRKAGAGPNAAERLRLVLRDVVVRDAAPPYDVFLAARSGGAARVRLGSLAQFGGAGRGVHSHGGGRTHPEAATVTFEASQAARDLAAAGVSLRRLAVAIVRRGFPQTSGGEFVPPDADPPQIGAIELLQG
jgi:hypothetical protein